MPASPSTTASPPPRRAPRTTEPSAASSAPRPTIAVRVRVLDKGPSPHGYGNPSRPVSRRFSTGWLVHDHAADRGTAARDVLARDGDLRHRRALVDRARDERLQLVSLEAPDHRVHAETGRHLLGQRRIDARLDLDRADA